MVSTSHHGGVSPNRAFWGLGRDFQSYFRTLGGTTYPHTGYRAHILLVIYLYQKLPRQIYLMLSYVHIPLMCGSLYLLCQFLSVSCDGLGHALCDGFSSNCFNRHLRHGSNIVCHSYFYYIKDNNVTLFCFSPYLLIGFVTG